MLGRITFNEAIMIVASKIEKETSQLTEQQRLVDDIMEGKQAYDDVSYLLSLDIKEKLRP